ncbi:PKD domain-containing protein [Aquiflexum sp.]|uniref:PKD domain-containing protein n=1 Tax=Aquiflexum sp. TaxID=1872584 RepID=UPI003592ECB7
MQALQSYPVFEADQVLSNAHLNNLLNYLEQQERLTRIKLVGRGIVCGMEINSSNQGIAISKGFALTSQGYMVQVCEIRYTHYVPYQSPELPNDLYFLKQCEEASREGIQFYGSQNVLELIPEDDSDVEEKAGINSLNLQDYVVILFLEAEQIDLKNCDTQDCNDKGSRMDFILKPLLVRRQDLNTPAIIEFFPNLLKRFNVPVGEMNTSGDILQGFLDITDDTTLGNLSKNLSNSWERFAVPLGLSQENPLKDLNLVEFRKRLDDNPIQRIYLQYFYDFVDDLIKAHTEFQSKVNEVFGQCCPDEMEFPLHIGLGLANENTQLGRRNAFRHYFEPSPILDGQSKKVDEAALLLERIVAMVKGVSFEKLNPQESIIITPSNLGHEFLSKRAIPYFYEFAPLNLLWSFKQSYKGNESFNLGYRAASIATSPEQVKNPLLYDIESFDSFRIEGHIGKNYQVALREIIGQKQGFNLPIDVLALNAIDLSSILNGKEIRCHIEDLESDYRVMITGIVCQLQQIIAYVGNLRPQRTVPASDPVLESVKLRDFYISKNLRDIQKTIKNDISKNQAISVNNSEIISKLALRDVEPGEKLADLVALDLGNFIVNYKPLYAHIIKQPDLLLIFLQQLAEIVKYLLSKDLQSFDEDAYGNLWTPYSQTVEKLILEAPNSENQEFQRYFSRSNHELLFKCPNERLFALREEFKSRVEQYYAAVNFSEYFKKHPGLEHKAGVPKGGTFIIVYHGVPRQTATRPNLSFVGEIANIRDVPNLALREVNVGSSISNSSNILTNKNILTTNVPSLKKTEYAFASDLIKNLNLGFDISKIIEALDLRDREIKDLPLRIPEGTVIADFYLPYMCCSDCQPIAYILPEEKEPENIGPVADAGPDQTIPFTRPTTATLDGSASSDEDGTITEFSWIQESGDSTVIDTPEQAQTTVQFESPGQYVFILKVTDDKGASAEDSVTINVTAPENIPPIAEAGPDQTITFIPTAPVTANLDGSGSTDSDGTITVFSWSQQSGPTARINTPDQARTSVVFPSPGQFVFALKVTEDRGASAEDNVTVNVITRQNNPPVADAGQDQSIFLRNPNTPGTVNLDGRNSSDPENGVLSFSWSFEGGTMTPTITNPDQAQTTVTGLLVGEYRFGLKVTDPGGNSSSDSVTVRVTVRGGDDDVRVKNCGPFTDILRAFEEFDRPSSNDLFNNFIEMYSPYGQIKEFFTAMRIIAEEPAEKQIEFFANELVNTGLLSQFTEWLQALHDLLIEIKQLRSLAFALYRILEQLAVFIACIQNEDVDVAKIPMENVFASIEDNAHTWAALRESGDFGRLELQLVLRIANDMAAAMAQIEGNGETDSKPKYLNQLKNIRAIL